MSQTYFSKLALEEKVNRLGLLGTSKGELTLWIKGQTQKTKIKAQAFHKDRTEIVLDTQEKIFPLHSKVLCSFELRGMLYFSETVFSMSMDKHGVLQLMGDVFKSEKRASYRLLTYPIFNISAQFEIGETYEGGKVVDFKTKISQTGLFKNFLKMVEENDGGPSKLRLRVQDLSTTGMGIYLGEIESKYFEKDKVFKDVILTIAKEDIIIPEVKVVYVVDFIGADANLKKFKLGLQFLNLPNRLDEQLGGIINKMLRDSNTNKDFENFLK